ncbi:hypothetical protein C8T65DRAFT_632399 [Cerioporus squamosus]|nr:hypothetical protein C8T65DRAFT_632399 [Cerioporus squamosus]
MSITGSSYVLGDYPLFQSMTNSISNDPDLTDDQLYECATAYLKAFDDPECFRHNRPYWVPAAYLRGSKFSVKHLIEAFYHTAQDLHLSNGSRYILASVCACGRLVDKIVDGAESRKHVSRSQLLARELGTLAHDVWLKHFIILQTLLDDSVKPSEALRQQLLQRDTYTCFKTGEVDIEAPRPLEAPHSRYTALYGTRHVPTPICQGIMTNWRMSRDGTLLLKDTAEIFEQYLEIKNICALLDSTRNHLFLSPLAARLFTSYRWTLKPTQKPNRFKVVDHSGSYSMSLGAPHGQYVTFSDHSGRDQSGIELPSRDNLMVHAAYTSILHRSGLVGWADASPMYSLMDCYLGADDDEDDDETLQK